jgi:hypothetical protein
LQILLRGERPLLKALFDGEYVLAADGNVAPNEAGSGLLVTEDAPTSNVIARDCDLFATLTVRGELDELASNVALAETARASTTGATGSRVPDSANARRFASPRIDSPSYTASARPPRRGDVRWEAPNRRTDRRVISDGSSPLADRTPYTVAIVELDSGARLTGRVTSPLHRSRHRDRSAADRSPRRSGINEALVNTKR